ncbi:tetratricopeptide repeat protein [Hylemonella sp. W303a]|uniref:O-linked N-acetylglucosamine transferase, SPINDLY family protein n=1 Tax=Hylemonella sp. W303a TaxID=3389873 RepID=UPI00396B4217
MSAPNTSHQADPSAVRISQAFLKHDWVSVVRLCRQTLRKNGRHLRSHQMLGFALNQLKKTDQALAAYRQAAAMHPEDAELLINYVQILMQEGRPSDAYPVLKKVTALRPDKALSWIHLARSCYPMTLHEEGLAAANKAWELAESTEDKLGALNQRAIHRRELGQVHEAVEDCKAAIALNPADIAHHTNLLLFMLADPAASVQDMAEAARNFGTTFEAALKPAWPDHAARREGGPWRRLKVGFISPDFHNHAVMYFAEGLLAQLDRRQFEIWAFDLGTLEDTAAERVRCHVDHHVKLHLKHSVEQAAIIQEAGIDILIDLSGHTGGNALPTMARKPAPVQAFTIGYPGTTGLTAIDWWFSDGITDPPGAEALYTEQLYRLPTRWICYRPHSRNPLWRYQPAYQVRPTPALANGFVTFGSCNNLGKLTDEVLALWGRILAAVPNSRLLIEGKNLGLPEFSASYRARCERLGIDVSRLDLVPLDYAKQYLVYHRVDIALDPFPLVGGTTSNDVIWMGVPLITMNGDALKSRMGVGMLAHMGRHDWIARNPDEYVAIASRLASDVESLNRIRLGLRDEVEASTVMREDVYTQEVGNALRFMWMLWLAGSSHPEWTPEQVFAQVEAWVGEAPTWPEQEFQVGVAPGERIPLTKAYERLQTMIARAKTDTDEAPAAATNQILSKRWFEATVIAERILSAKPHDAVALTALAEIENAHGNHEFGRVYLAEALKSLKPAEPVEQLLERTQRYVQAAREYLGEV